MLKDVLNKCFRRLLYFGDHSSLHGLRFVTEKCRRVWCRLFWIVALIGCGFGLHKMLEGTIRSYRQDSLTFNPDINRLEFQTNFPAISICEEFKYTSTIKQINKFFPGLVEKYDFNYRQMITDQCFGDKPCELCSSGCEPPVNCSLDFQTMARLVRKTCDELIHTCTWLDRPFNCCQYFLPIDTNYGTCFSLNTLQSDLSGSVPLLRLNISTGPGVISFAVHNTIKVYIHGSDEIPWSLSEPDLLFTAQDHTTFYFRVVEMTNDRLVESVDMETRKCRFRDEKIPSLFSSYQVDSTQIAFACFFMFISSGS